MSYATLKIVHLAGLALTFMGLAGVLATSATGDSLPKGRWLFRATHGLGLLLLLATGFALADQLKQMGNEMHPVPGWIKAKLGIWLLTGASLALAARLGRFAVLVLVFLTALVVAAAWLAIAKPF